MRCGTYSWTHLESVCCSSTARTSAQAGPTDLCCWTLPFFSPSLYDCASFHSWLFLFWETERCMQPWLQLWDTDQTHVWVWTSKYCLYLQVNVWISLWLVDDVYIMNSHLTKNNKSLWKQITKQTPSCALWWAALSHKYKPSYYYSLYGQCCLSASALFAHTNSFWMILWSFHFNKMVQIQLKFAL